MQVFVMITNAGTMINADVNANNWLTKVDGMMDLFGILASMNVKWYWTIYRLRKL